MLIKWEEKDPNVRSLWKKMNSWVYEGFTATYHRMGIDFDKNYFETLRPGAVRYEAADLRCAEGSRRCGGRGVELPNPGLCDGLHRLCGLREHLP